MIIVALSIVLLILAYALGRIHESRRGCPYCESEGVVGVPDWLEGPMIDVLSQEVEQQVMGGCNGG